MIPKRTKSVASFTLIETMTATVVLAIAALGALSLQYHTAGHSRIAREQTTATRTAQLLLEDWKSNSAAANYNPATLGLGFSPSPVQPEDIDFVMEYNQMGSLLNGMLQHTTIDDVPMKALLAWKAIDTDGTMELRQLSVIIKWDENSDITPVVLTTYVRVDILGG